MEQKKILLVLKSDTEQNNKLVEFIHHHFFYCSVDSVFLDYPVIKSEKRIGDYFKNLITNSNSYYKSNNKYNLIQQESLSSEVFNLMIDYYDMMVTNHSDYNQIIEIISSHKSRQWAFLPTLIIPDKHVDMIGNVVFVSTQPENTIIAFKKFCYLFPTICKEGETVLLRFMDYSKELQSSDGEKLLYEYLKTKCSRFSVHKVRGKLQSADTKAINLTKNTLFVVDKPNINLASLIEKEGSKNGKFPSFWLSA